MFNKNKNQNQNKNPFHLINSIRVRIKSKSFKNHKNSNYLQKKYNLNIRKKGIGNQSICHRKVYKILMTLLNTSMLIYIN